MRSVCGQVLIPHLVNQLLIVISETIDSSFEHYTENEAVSEPMLLSDQLV